jgi:hypothetical protein
MASKLKVVNADIISKLISSNVRSISKTSFNGNTINVEITTPINISRAKIVQKNIFEFLQKYFSGSYDVKESNDISKNPIGRIELFSSNVPPTINNTYLIYVKCLKFNAFKTENIQIKNISESIVNGLNDASSNYTGAYVYLKFGNGSQDAFYITGVQKVGNKNKADIMFTTTSGNNIYVSLKGDTYRQWGGLSDFSSEKDVIKFADAVNMAISAGKKPPFARSIVSNDELKLKSIYGKDYVKNSNQTYGINNVNYVIIGSGLKIIKRSGGGFKFDACKVYKSGTIIGKPYFRAKKDIKRNDFGIKHMRLSVYSSENAPTETIV